MDGTSRKISRHLRYLFQTDERITLDYVYYALNKKVSRETINQAKKGNRRLRDKTAYKLAEFIERESNGEIKADQVLAARTKDFHGQHLKGTRCLAGEDLCDADFSFSVLENVELSSSHLDGASFTRSKLANVNLGSSAGTALDLTSAQITDCKFPSLLNRWDFTGATINGEVREVEFREVTMHGADFRGSDFKSVALATFGSLARGVWLPDLDPGEISEAFALHSAVNKLVIHEFQDDLDMVQFAEFVLSSRIPDYDEAVLRVENACPDKMEDLEKAFARHNKTWHILDRWELQKKIKACHTIKELDALKDLPCYAIFKSDSLHANYSPVDRKIRELIEEEAL